MKYIFLIYYINILERFIKLNKTFSAMQIYDACK